MEGIWHILNLQNFENVEDSPAMQCTESRPVNTMFLGGKIRWGCPQQSPSPGIPGEHHHLHVTRCIPEAPQ